MSPIVRWPLTSLTAGQQFICNWRLTGPHQGSLCSRGHERSALQRASRRENADLSERSEPQPTFAAETPLDAASRHHDAGDVPAEVLLQSGPPWRKLDSEPVSIVAIRPNNSRSQNLSIGSPPHGSLQFGMRQR